jgi:aminoglycoside 3-N-acetyltransferase
MLKGLKGFVKVLLKRWQKQRNLSVRERTQPHIDKTQIIHGLLDMGVVPGDTLFLHSSLKSLGYVTGGPRAVIEALLDAVGSDGTVILPAYSMPGGSIYRACETPNYVFDPHIHGTGMGALPVAFLQFPGVERSIHPTHSCAAIGKQARYLTEAHHLAPSVFGPGSPWERCLAINGKVMGLGISMGPVTFYHLLEDSMGDAFPLPVKMPKVYAMPCKDWQGREIVVPVQPLDPAFQPRRIDHKSRSDLRDYFYSEFSQAGYLKSGHVGTARVWYISAQDFYGHLKELMLQGITIYSTVEELAARPLE